jgi:hypothetical protein
VNNAHFCIEPGDTYPKSVSFKANEGIDRQTDMIALRDFKPVLTTFHTGELFEATMVDFNRPGIQGVTRSLRNVHIQAAGSPVFCVAVCADRPKHLDPALAFEMNTTSLRRD